MNRLVLAALAALTIGIGCAYPRPTVEGGGVPRHITLKAFGFWSGTFEWAADRDALTREQTDAIAGLRQIEGTDGCAADVRVFELRLVNDDGSVTTATGNQANAACDEDELIDFTTLEPLLAATGCVATGESTTTLSGATPTIGTGDGCRHGFFSYEAQPSTWVKVAPTTSGPHTFELLECGGKTTALELFDASGGTRLAAGSGDDGAACATLTHHLEAGAVYALEVTATAVQVGGHVLLEVVPE